ncbi:CPBP family intramembrane glutamic endopeptidase [Marivirga tractuosa]|uniref:CPBP family glutamic-type intramembrane protease n=1 Tax=Marivirga tractuosa TaxID=1006 RepID=UPI0035D07593
MIIPAVFIVFLIQEFSELDFDNHAISDLTNNYGLLALILVGGILMPFIEELLFRLPLNYKRNYLFKLVGRIIGREKVKNFWFKYFKIFFYLFIIAFGLVHITNYRDESTDILLFSPFLVLPQIIGGTIMAYLRMNLGFAWGFLQHAIFNTALMLITFYTNLEEKVTIDNNDFKLKIEVAENRFGKEKIININRDFDFITEIDIKYAKFNQIAKQLNWDSIDSKHNYKHYNIDFTIKNLEIKSDSVLQKHLMEIIEDQ